MYDLQGYEASILKGAVLTIEVALLSLILAMVLGVLGALAKLAPYPLTVMKLSLCFMAQR